MLLESLYPLMGEEVMMRQLLPLCPGDNNGGLAPLMVRWSMSPDLGPQGGAPRVVLSPKPCAP